MTNEEKNLEFTLKYGLCPQEEVGSIFLRANNAIKSLTTRIHCLESQLSRGIKTLIICDSCKGYGVVYKSHLVDYHKSEYDTTKHTCTKCDGTGRLVKYSDFITKMAPESSGDDT